VFRRGLVPLLEKIHGNLEHKGKIPVHATERLERQKQIVALRRQLNEAIQKEAYEDAARLRDEIYALEEQVA
jgi:protein arginine kinase activator